MRIPARRLPRLPWRSAARIQADVDEELRFELDMRTAELVRLGVPEREARGRALAEFGDLEATRRACAALDRASERAARRAEWMAELRQDATLAWRGMRRTPGFALVVLVTLALGIGANTAVFSVVRQALLDRLPYRDPEHLVRLYGGTAGNPAARGMLAAVEVAELQRASVFTGVAAFGFYGGYTYVGDRGAEMWAGVQVGPELFRVLGTRPHIGRVIDARDVGPDAAPVVVLSYALWQRTFGGDARIIGRDVRLNGRAYTVVGVMPPQFIFPERDPEIWTPLDLTARLRNPIGAQGRALRVVARLADGVTPEQLRTALDLVAGRVHDQHPELREPAPANAVPLHDDMVGEARPVLLVVMGAALLVLALACVNVAGLFLARATARRQELAVRAALGAGRARLVRQLLTESAVIALWGGAIGVVLALSAKHALAGVAALLLPWLQDVRIDARVLTFAVVISLVSALAFGLAPALTSTRLDLHGSLAESSRGASGGPVSARLGRALVIVQIGLAVVLLIGAGLLGRTLAALDETGVGFATGSDALTFRVNLSSAQYTGEARRLAFFDAFTEALETLPGVRAVGMVDVAPWNGYTAGGRDSLVVESRAARVRGADLASRVTVSEGYFAALGVPVREGRAFTPSDRDGAPLVALVSEGLARRYWPGRSPLGQRIRIGAGNAPWRQVVGVVGDLRARPSVAPEPTVYIPMRQNPQAGADIVVRTTGDAAALLPAIRRTLHTLDPELPLVRARTTDTVLHDMLSGQRLPLAFTAAFAALALVLAGLGVYSVMAYSVTARERELGIRTALGARRADLLALVIRQGMAMAVAGTTAGLLAAAATTRVLAGLLYGVTPHDPATFAGVALTLLGVSAAASLLPARRATRVEPADALRAQ